MDIRLERLFHTVKYGLFLLCDPKMDIEILFFYVQHLLISSVKI